MTQLLLTRYLQPLLAGRRAECVTMIQEAVASGAPAESLLCDVVWPATAQIDRLFRTDRINVAAESMAARINRTVADQLQLHLPRRTSNGRRVVIVGAPQEREEIGAQVMADLLQASGWEVYLLGPNVPHDEMVALLGQVRPDALLIVGAAPQFVPDIRGLIDRIREIGVCPKMNVVVSGGVFERADGLWQEIGADASADDARDALRLLDSLAPRASGPPRRGIVKKRHRRRKAQPATNDRPTPVTTHA